MYQHHKLAMKLQNEEVHFYFACTKVYKHLITDYEVERCNTRDWQTQPLHKPIIILCMNYMVEEVYQCISSLPFLCAVRFLNLTCQVQNVILHNYIFWKRPHTQRLMCTVTWTWNKSYQIHKMNIKRMHYKSEVISNQCFILRLWK